jgi:hypothetical protein
MTRTRKQIRPPKPGEIRTAAIRRRLEFHARSCTYFIFSGDRHCSCGRNIALLELESIERALGIDHGPKL